MDPHSDVVDELGHAAGGAQVGAESTASEQLLALFEKHRLSPTQRRIGQYLLEHMPDAAFLSSVDLASRAGVSQPSVTRFAVALGLPGYPKLREVLRQIALAAAVDTSDVARRNALQIAIAGEIRNLAALQESLTDPSRVLQLGRALAASQPLTVIGLRISAPLAEYFAYAAAHMHPDVRCIVAGGSAAADVLLQARSAGGSWVLAFAMPRYPAELTDALGYATSLGLRTAVVADGQLAPVGADVLLAAPVSSQLIFDSHAAPNVLAAVLLQAMADAEPGRTQASLDAFEELAERRRIFVQR